MIPARMILRTSQNSTKNNNSSNDSNDHDKNDRILVVATKMTIATIAQVTALDIFVVINCYSIHKNQQAASIVRALCSCFLTPAKSPPCAW